MSRTPAKSTQDGPASLDHLTPAERTEYARRQAHIEALKAELVRKIPTLFDGPPPDPPRQPPKPPGYYSRYGPAASAATTEGQANRQVGPCTYPNPFAADYPSLGWPTHQQARPAGGACQPPQAAGYYSRHGPAASAATTEGQAGRQNKSTYPNPFAYDPRLRSPTHQQALPAGPACQSCQPGRPCAAHPYRAR